MPRPIISLARTATAALVLAAGPCFAQDNPFARYATPPAQLVNGTWNGVDLERRSNCTNAVNDGSRGTYGEFDISTDSTGYFAIGQSSITGLNCSYSGRYTTTNGALGVQGTYSCSDGKQGTFQSTKLDVNGTTLTLQMNVQLTGTETCTISAILGLARFYP